VLYFNGKPIGSIHPSVKRFFFDDEVFYNLDPQTRNYITSSSAIFYQHYTDKKPFVKIREGYTLTGLDAVKWYRKLYTFMGEGYRLEMTFDYVKKNKTKKKLIDTHLNKMDQNFTTAYKTKLNSHLLLDMYLIKYGATLVDMYYLPYEGILRG
jgi:hypothetical protein